MDTLEAIATRRSIRKYTPQPVDGEIINIILAAAMQAPSAGNEQPWHFIVVRDAIQNFGAREKVPTFCSSKVTHQAVP